jgi:hypothetical protein
LEKLEKRVLENTACQWFTSNWKGKQNRQEGFVDEASSMQCIGMVVDARDSKQMLLMAAHASSSRKAPGEESLQRREEEERRRGHGEGERNLML